MRSLVAIKLPTSISKIPAHCFQNVVTLQSIEIPEGVSAIDEYAFNFCPELSTIKFPSTLKVIGKEAFYHAQKLSFKTFNEGLERIEKSAFGQVLGLEEVTMPSTLKYLGETVFEACQRLKEVNLNEGLEYIGGAVFTLTPYLKDITIPSTVKTIQYNPLLGTGEAKIIMAKGNLNYKVVDEVLFNKDMTTLISYPYSKITKDDTYRVPDSVTELGYNCFSMISKLDVLTLPTSIKKTNCSFDTILPDEVSKAYELSIYYEGNKDSWLALDHGEFPWNINANFKDNVLHCKDGDIKLNSYH